MPRCKELLNIRLLVLKRNSIRQNSAKGIFCRSMRTSAVHYYTTFANTTKKYSSNKRGYLAYQKLSRLNTKTRKLYDKLKDTYGITVGTDLPQCAEPPNPIVKYANCNKIPTQNCT